VENGHNADGGVLDPIINDEWEADHATAPDFTRHDRMTFRLCEYSADGRFDRLGELVAQPIWRF